MNNDNFQEIMKYKDMIKVGKKAELHYRINTGEIRCFYTISITGDIGNGTPQAPRQGWLVIC